MRRQGQRAFLTLYVPAETVNVIEIECAGTRPPLTVTTSVNLGADRFPNRKHRTSAIEHLERQGFEPAVGRYEARDKLRAEDAETPELALIRVVRGRLREIVGSGTLDMLIRW